MNWQFMDGNAVAERLIFKITNPVTDDDKKFIIEKAESLRLQLIVGYISAVFDYDSGTMFIGSKSECIEHMWNAYEEERKSQSGSR